MLFLSRTSVDALKICCGIEDSRSESRKMAKKCQSPHYALIWILCWLLILLVVIVVTKVYLLKDNKNNSSCNLSSERGTIKLWPENRKKTKSILRGHMRFHKNRLHCEMWNRIIINIIYLKNYNDVIMMFEPLKLNAKTVSKK